MKYMVCKAYFTKPTRSPLATAKFIALRMYLQYHNTACDTVTYIRHTLLAKTMFAKHKRERPALTEKDQPKRLWC